MEITEYRTRVEKLPDEDFKRFYPESRTVENNVVSNWRNTQIPIEIRWYNSLDECEKHLKNLFTHQKKLNSDFTIETITYPK